MLEGREQSVCAKTPGYIATFLRIDQFNFVISPCFSVHWLFANTVVRFSLSIHGWLFFRHDIQKFISCSLSQKCLQMVGICRDTALRSRCPLLVVVGGTDCQAEEEGCKRHVYGTMKHSDIAFLEQCDITRDFWKITIIRPAAAKLQGAGS